MERLALALALLGVAVVAAALISRRASSRATAASGASGSAGEPTFHVPEALDRSLFERPASPWLVAAFTSVSCSTCASVVERMGPLASDQVAIQEVEVGRRPELHELYGVDAVPLVVVADPEGRVRAHAFGPQTAAGLWSLVAGVREGDG